MTNQIVVTCFADMEDSTLMTETLGNTGMSPIRIEYLTVSKSLAERNQGTYIKNIGDASMITFSDLESALNFAAQLQQFYQPQGCCTKSPIVSRIGLFLGVVENYDRDVFGSGVNQAARVEGKTEPGTIWVNKQLVEAIRKVWGKANARPFFTNKGEFDLKGITDPPKQQLYSFDWQRYAQTHPEKTLSSLIYKQFQDASVILSNIPSVADISPGTSTIWPVVPRDGVNAIHRGQLEIIHLLAMIGSKVHVLIADCGVTETFPRKYSESFKRMIHSYATKRCIKDIEYAFMSDLFAPRCDGCEGFHRQFQTVISQLTLEELLDINRKEYSKDVQKEIDSAATLDFLRPALTISSVLHLSATIGGKCIVVAGYDERKQWESAHRSIPATRTQFGVLFNPVLKAKKGFQGRQKKDWPLYFNRQQLIDDMAKYDLAPWFIKLHLFLSSFPASSVTIDGAPIKPDEWMSADAEKRIMRRITRAKLTDHLFKDILAI